MSLVRQFLHWISPDTAQEIEADAENVNFDKTKVDELFTEMLISAKRTRRTLDAFVVAGELFVKDVRGVAVNEKVHARSKKSK